MESITPWFEVHQVAADSFALREPNHVEAVVSYLIVGDERAVLFDTGMGVADIRREVEHLTTLPVVVVNSHSHYDHVGDDYRFDEVWAFDNDGEVAHIERGLTVGECASFLSPGTYKELPPGFDPTQYHIRPSPVTRRLQHLETIELGERTLTVHYTPGHSPGDICLHDSREGLLLTGDTFYPDTLYAQFEDSDFDAYRRSLAYLVTLLDQVSQLCPAHGDVYAPKELLIGARDALDQIAAGEAEPEKEEGGIRFYQFDAFWVAVR